MTVPTKILRLRSAFIFDESDTELLLTLPITPWNPSAMSIGGDIESDAGVRASFIICQRETLSFSLRFFESQWKDVQAWLDVVQDGMPFTWIPDPQYQNYPQWNDVILEAPAIGTKFQATPDPQYPRVLQLPITLGRLGCSLWNLKEIPPPPVIKTFNQDGRVVVTGVSGRVSLIATVIGGGAGSTIHGGGGGGVIFEEFSARVGTIFVHVGDGGDPGLAGAESTVNYPLEIGSGDIASNGGGAPFGSFGGPSGSPTTHSGGGGTGVGFVGTPPDHLDAYDANAGGGGGGADEIGHDATLGVRSAIAGKGGDGLETPHGKFGGGGGGGSTSSGVGSSTPGSSGDGGGGNGVANGEGEPGEDGSGGGAGGGSTGARGGKGKVLIEWQLGEVIATQEIP